MTTPWPTAELDPVRRLRALAAGVPGAAVTERLVAAPFKDVWGVLTDFEGGFAYVQPDMREVRVVARSAESISLSARSHLGMRAALTGVNRPGYCWLQSRLLIVAMAATPEGAGGTRVALTGGIRLPRRRGILPIGVRRESTKTLDRLEHMLDTRPA